MVLQRRFPCTRYFKDVVSKVQLVDKAADITVDMRRLTSIIQSAQKTVEVQRAHCIDKVTDILVDVQRQTFVIQSAQCHMQQHDEEVDAPAFMQGDGPIIQNVDDPCHSVTGQDDSDDMNEDADEDQLEHENKKRSVTKPTEMAVESSVESKEKHRRIEPSAVQGAGPASSPSLFNATESKTLCVSIASNDEAEDEAEDSGAEGWVEVKKRGRKNGTKKKKSVALQEVDETDTQCPGRELVRAAPSQECVQEMRETRMMVADDVRGVNGELLHVRELFGVLVRRESLADAKTEIAARRLDRMEKEKDEVDDAELEALCRKPALAQQVKSSSSTIGTDAWAQVVSDHARAEEGAGYRARRA